MQILYKASTLHKKLGSWKTNAFETVKGPGERILPRSKMSGKWHQEFVPQGTRIYMKGWASLKRKESVKVQEKEIFYITLHLTLTIVFYGTDASAACQPSRLCSLNESQCGDRGLRIKCSRSSSYKDHIFYLFALPCSVLVTLQYHLT